MINCLSKNELLFDIELLEIVFVLLYNKGKPKEKMMRDYNYGSYLYGLRKSLNMTQEELGRALNISNKAVSKWETGESKPAMKQLYALSQLFKVSLEELMEVCNRKDKIIHKIVITGGPCAGKSTALSWIQAEYTKKGYAVLFVPESATELILSGISLNTMSSRLEFQKSIMINQLNKEKLYEDSAYNLNNSDKVLIVCDRGALDGKAYMDKLEFNQLLRIVGKSEVELRDSYDAVFHLVTAAKGAEEFYTKDTNLARRENLEEARIADEKTLTAWAGHPHLRVIDNSTGFEDKIKRLIKEVSSYLGEPQPYEIERKFLIKYPDLSALNNPTLEKIEIIQTYLRSQNPNEEIRIRQRGIDGHFVYTRTVKRGDGLKRFETEKRISKDQYLAYLMDADPSYRQIRKTRYCFVHNNQYLEIDVYPFWKDKAILEVEINNEEGQVDIPSEITIIKEVTEDKKYKNTYISKNYEKFAKNNNE